MSRRNEVGLFPVDFTRAGTEATMCHYRSYVSDDKARADAERQKELSAKRQETVGSLLHPAKPAQSKPAEPAVIRETAPAK
jgi:hypothetical protein